MTQLWEKRLIALSGILVLLLVMSSSVAMAEDNFQIPQLASDNPAFFQNQTNEILNQTEPSLDRHRAGLTPEPVNLSYLSSTSFLTALAPAYYDLRTLDRVTTVKDQGGAGSYWAFATYGSLESYLMPGENWNFSENNMKNMLSSAYSEGFDLDANDGGDIFMSTAYLTRWSGPVQESDDPYNDTSEVSPENLPLKKHVQNVSFLPNRKGPLDNEAIKWALQNYGAVYAAMYYNDTYYSSNNSSYYNNESSYNNHAVDIVGWDDSFDRNNFSQIPPGDGAFIVKNSWGEDWGENGYFYISYYDPNIGTENAVFTAENPDNYKSIYQYDPLGWVMGVGYNNSVTAWIANIFTAKSDELLKAVSFYATDTNCNYEIYIYANPTSGPINEAGPIYSKNGAISVAGYHTIPLDSDVRLTEGQNFSVVLKLTTPECDYPLAVEMPYKNYSSNATANPGESFISYDGNTWEDISVVDPFFSNTNVCIKAFTNPDFLPVANFTSNVTEDYTPLYVQFNDSSKNATEVRWEFGDGSPDSNESNPIHVFEDPGSYIVNLTAANANGTDSMSATITVLDTLSYTIDGNVTNVSGRGHDGSVTESGDLIIYQINVTNNGKIDLNNVSVNVSNPQLNLTRSNSSINDDEILNAGETWIYQVNYTVTQADINNNGAEGDGSIKIRATVDCKELAQKSFIVQVPIERNPRLSIFKSVISPDEDGDCIVNSAGDKIPYRIIVKNEGNVDLTNITVDDTMITLTGPAGDDNDSEVLNPGEIWVYTGVYTLTAHDITDGNGYITNNATVSCKELPDKSSNVETPIEQKADFSIYKSVIGIDEAGDYMINKPGDVISYQVAVRNNGDVKLTGISISDPLVTLTGPSGDHNDPGILNPRETWVYTGDYEITQEDIGSNGNGDGFIENTATASCKELSDESSSLVLRIIQTPPTVVTPESNNSKVPVANFSINTTSGYPPLSVQFTDLSQNAVSRSWDFNNDGTADSSNANPIYTYTTQGIYTAKLTSINPNGTDSKTAAITVLKAANSSIDSISASGHRNGDNFGEAHVIRSNSNDVSSSSDTGTVTKLENNPQDPEQNNENAVSNVEQTTKQKNKTSTPAKESKSTPGFEIAFGIVCLLGVFLYKRR